MPAPLEDDCSQDQEYAEEDDIYDSEEDESAFVNFALLSHLAVRLRDRVPRGTHVKGSIPYPRAFTGKDIVVRTMTLTLNGMMHYSYCSTDNHSGPNTARTAHQPRHLDERSKGGHRSRS
jgi:RHO1 GDP-GTP exchange protein 1/2